MVTALHAVRAGRWKLHLPHGYRHVTEPGRDGLCGKDVEQREELALYDLESDRAETKNVAAEHPDIVARLQAFAEQAREDLGDAATQRKGANLRPRDASIPSAAAACCLPGVRSALALRRLGGRRFLGGPSCRLAGGFAAFARGDLGQKGEQIGHFLERERIEQAVGHG